jgi:hypothetical protein
MSDQQVAANDRGLSTADLASAVPDQETRETERPLDDEDLADEGQAELDEDRPAETTREDDEDLADERHTELDEARPAETTRGGVTDEAAPPLFAEEKVTGYRDRWQLIQTGFVDDPHQSVREADELVAAVISELATTFAEHKSELEGQWQQGEPATEELRVALRRYRAFFDELLPH